MDDLSSKNIKEQLEKLQSYKGKSLFIIQNLEHLVMKLSSTKECRVSIGPSGKLRSLLIELLIRHSKRNKKKATEYIDYELEQHKET